MNFLTNQPLEFFLIGLEVLILAVTLSLDAFSVSLSKGMAVCNYKPKHSILCGAWFGVFQGLMPLIGYFAFKLLKDNVSFIESLDHWFAFIALGFIGGKMIYESFKEGEENQNSSFKVKVMLGMAIATSIDALAAGIPLATNVQQNIWVNVIAIAVITFIFSALGVFLGHKLGSKLKEKIGNKVEIIGGIILISLGLKILIEHLFFS